MPLEQLHRTGATFSQGRRLGHDDHVAGEPERRAARMHRIDRGSDDARHHLAFERGRQHRCRRVCAHAAGVRSLVAVEDALVILCARQRYDVLTIGKHEEARFFTA